VDKYFEPLLVKGVSEFITVPNTTPGDGSYNPEYLKQAIAVVKKYADQFQIDGLNYKEVTLED
jgi:hypothetical protein